MAKNVTVIPPTINLFTKTSRTEPTKRKVAGYARVSTDSEEQLTSYEAQVDYYSNYIRANPEWEFVDVYTDEGITALNTKKREGFNRMIADALDGKIDLIVTKSVSRFARNTVDSLTTVRKLKEHGVEVYFQKENIYTLDSKGELLITIMSSLAQEESRSISENVTWGQRKRFADGKVSIPYGQFLGYRKGADGLPEIVPEEAEIVRDIYRMFIEGMSTNAIAKRLTDNGVPTPSGKSKWQRQTIDSILANEKYKGSALLQKKFTIDFLQKKMKPNEGEVPQYYVEHSHPPIIPPDEWERVQLEIARRRNSEKRTNCGSPFSAKLVCGDCGEFYGSKVWHSNSKYRRTIWQCNGKFKGDCKCRTPHLYEEQIKEQFISALSELLSDRETLLDNGRLILEQLTDCSEIDTELHDISVELDLLAGLIRSCIFENAVTAIEQSDYTERYNKLTEKHEELQNRYAELRRQREERLCKADALGEFLFRLSELDLLELSFDNSLWNWSVERVAVFADGEMRFRFKNGVDI